MTCLNAFYHLAIPPAWTGCNFLQIKKKLYVKMYIKLYVVFFKLYIKMYIKIFLLSSLQEVTQKAATMTLSAGRSWCRHATPQKSPKKVCSTPGHEVYHSKLSLQKSIVVIPFCSKNQSSQFWPLVDSGMFCHRNWNPEIRVPVHNGLVHNQ